MKITSSGVTESTAFDRLAHLARVDSPGQVDEALLRVQCEELRVITESFHVQEASFVDHNFGAVVFGQLDGDFLLADGVGEHLDAAALVLVDDFFDVANALLLVRAHLGREIENGVAVRVVEDQLVHGHLQGRVFVEQ